MLEIVTKIYGQRVQRFQNGDQHQRQRKRCNLPRIHLVAYQFEEFQLRRAAIQPGIRPEALVQFEQAAFRHDLTAEGALDVDDAVETVADLFHIRVCQLYLMQIVEAQGTLLTGGAIQFGYFLDQIRVMWSGGVGRPWRITSRVDAGRVVDDGFVYHRFVGARLVHFDEQELQ